MPRVGVLGTGQVGQAIARRAAEVGYDVLVGARRADSPSLHPFAEDAGIRTGSFADAVAFAPVVVNATNGANSIAALSSVDPGDLHGTVLLDLSNELEPVTDGFPLPTASATSSVGQRIQAAFPGARVVKTLNTMNNDVMVHPERIAGDHLAFLCGDDGAAKSEAATLLRTFGWRDEQLMDLGGIDAAPAVEMMMAIWMRVTIARGPSAPRFNWAILSATSEIATS